MTDPVHHYVHSIDEEYHIEDNPASGWYFWDESWGYRYGPYETRELCATALNQYCREALGDPNTSFS